MDDIKIAAIERQLMCGGIHDARIINAFSAIDREDFVEPKHKMYAYADVEISINDLNDRFLLRPLLLARVAEKILELPHDKILIVGDYCNYTLSVFSRIFADYSFVGERDLGAYAKKGFNIVFFDSGFYSDATLGKGLETLTAKGTIITLVRGAPIRFSLRKNLCEWMKCGPIKMEVMFK
jgi:protein-L-isoaspartate O-methyltransferase